MISREQEIRNEFERQLRELHEQQDACNHDWTEPEYDPEITMKPSKYEMVRQGSDIWERPCEWEEVSTDRWSKKCKKCGKVEYTKETIPIKFKPKF